MLAKTFVIHEEKCAVMLDGAAERCAKLITAKVRHRPLIEEITRIKETVAHKIIERTVPVVGSRLRDDADLCAGPLAVLGAIGVGYYVELAHGFHTQQQTAGAAGRHVDFSRSRVLYTIDQKQVFLRTAALHREGVGHSGIGDTDAAGFLRSVVHDARIERQQIVVAAAVQRQIAELSLADQASGFIHRCAERRGRRRYGDLLAERPNLQNEVDVDPCPFIQTDALANLSAEAFLLRTQRVPAGRQGKEHVISYGAAARRAL